MKNILTFLYGHKYVLQSDRDICMRVKIRINGFSDGSTEDRSVFEKQFRYITTIKTHTIKCNHQTAIVYVFNRIILPSRTFNSHLPTPCYRTNYKIEYYYFTLLNGDDER